MSSTTQPVRPVTRTPFHARRMTRRAGVLACGALATLLFSSCATRQPLRGQTVTGLDRTLTGFTYVESGDLVELIVNTKPTRLREDGPYVPIEIVVANRGLKKLTLTRESFVLIDEDKNRYPVAGPQELMRGYSFLDFDRNPAIADVAGVVAARYEAYSRLPSKFSPTRVAERNRSNLVRDLVVLPKFGYLIDVVYFPLPSTGVKGRQFELFLQAPELPDPVFVRFLVKGDKKKS